MCGIAGFYSPSHQFSRQDLEKMTARLSHRGPDAEGFYINDEKTIGLGHRRLSVIDLSAAANQPLWSHDGRYAIAFNGEIYNYREIAEKLQIQTRTTSDTEVVIEAFSKVREELPRMMNGMFALAIYDAIHQQLLLFRDRMGVKPLYYFFDGKNLAFASEMKALLTNDYIKRNIRLNKKAVYTFLYAGYIPEPSTIYENIYRLPAGSYATVTSKGLEIKSYWKPEERIREGIKEDFDSAKIELKELLTSSVRYRMISDVPFGTFLSGGIDSSTVTAIAQSISSQPVKTFSIGFKEAKFNESEYARKVSKHLGTEHHEFMVTENDALEMIDRMLTVYDEPYADSSGIPTMLVSKLARKHVTMTLSGDGGDELFMGYGAYDWAKRLDNPLIKVLRKPISASLSLLGNRYKRVAKVFDYKNTEHKKSHIFSQEQYFFSEAELKNILHPDFRHELLFQEQFKTRRQLSAAESQALFDLKYYLKDDLLVKVDIASMQFALEARTPFLDYRVVEFALNLSENLKKQNGISKYLLKEVLYDFVPKEIFDRPKWGFSVPLARWLKSDLKYLIDDYLNEDVIREINVVDADATKQLLKRFNQGEDFLYNRIWSLLLLHKWMKDNAAC
ncbi:MAG: asparagine synthase (glutamine-hydrolyzing) [Bacteroidetes bacterium]|nr:asparagine synthase (glutamine-hydrolyzing) [Bacteroidota bacterium]